MSFKSWKKEFYPIGADETEPEDAVAHSLKKWEGLTEENLKKHKCKIVKDVCGIGVKDDKKITASLYIDSDSCALCYHCYESGLPEPLCSTCLLFKHLKRKCDSGVFSPYCVFMHSKNPEPMIKALTAVFKKQQRGKNGKVSSRNTKSS